MISGKVVLELDRTDALVFASCLDRFFGEGSLHDWEDFSLNLQRESEQWPFWQLRDQLAGHLVAESTAANYDEILENAHNRIDAREWGKQN